MRANLKLDGCAERANQRCVQRLVAVDFWNGDVVFEPTWDWLESGVERPQRQVALRYRVDDDPHAVDIEDLRK